MPARHDLDPTAMTDEERRAKRRFEAGFVFETMPLPMARARADQARRAEAEAFAEFMAAGRS